LKKSEIRAATARGEHRVTVSVPWRLDGATDDPTAPLVVCLHGMGMDEDFFALLLQKLFVPPFRFLLPRGPYPVEVRGEGRIGASWYAYDGDQERFRRELVRTEELVLDLVRAVEAEERFEPRARVLFGFSQGGYCGSWVAVRNAGFFDGMIISGARVKTELLEDEMKAAAGHSFAALLCHGERDRSVKPESSARSRDALVAAGVDVELRTLAGGHSVSREQIRVASEWLTARFG
jgi:predicted esterase